MPNEELKKLVLKVNSDATKLAYQYAVSSYEDDPNYRKLIKNIHIHLSQTFREGIMLAIINCYIRAYVYGFTQARGLDTKVVTEVLRELCEEEHAAIIKENSNGKGEEQQQDHGTD